MKIKGVDIIICLLYYAVFKICVISAVLQQVTKVIAVAIVLLFLISHLKIKKLINISIPFSLAVCISTVYSYGMNTYENILNSFLYGLILYCLCTMLIYCRERDYIDGFINCFYRMAFVYVILTIISVLISRIENDTKSIIYCGK